MPPLEYLGAEVDVVRAKLLGDLTPLQTFALAIDRTRETVHHYVRQGLPCVYIAEHPYISIREGGDWLRARKLRKPCAPAATADQQDRSA